MGRSGRKAKHRARAKQSGKEREKKIERQFRRMPEEPVFNGGRPYASRQRSSRDPMNVPK
jgi:hypothetical protein